VITLLIILLVLALLVRFGLPAYLRRVQKADEQSDEPATVIHSGKDASWHAPIFESSVESPFFSQTLAAGR
jgi:biopolymer transport protein ExbD